MEDFDKKVQSHRDSIDKIDKDILLLFKERFIHVKEVGELKVKLNIPMMQDKRVEHIFKGRESFAMGLGLPKSFGYQLYQLVLRYACDYQTDIMNNIDNHEEKT